MPTVSTCRSASPHRSPRRLPGHPSPPGLLSEDRPPEHSRKVLPPVRVGPPTFPLCQVRSPTVGVTLPSTLRDTRPTLTCLLWSSPFVPPFHTRVRPGTSSLSQTETRPDTNHTTDPLNDSTLAGTPEMELPTLIRSPFPTGSQAQMSLYQLHPPSRPT